MAVEIIEKGLTLTDRSAFRELHGYINAKRKTVADSAKALWTRQRVLVTIDSARSALEMGGVPPEWREEWDEMIVDFVRDDLLPEWVYAIESAGSKMTKRVEALQKQASRFQTTAESVKFWVDTHGGSLIVQLTEAQFKSIQALLQDQIAWGVTSPYVLAQRVKPFVGLTEREALAVIKAMTAMTQEGLPQAVIMNQVKSYASFLHNSRAFRIARTELSDSYNFGQIASLRQAQGEGLLPGEPVKTWMAGGIDPCDVCEGNEGDGEIPLDAQFSSGHDHPTAHPQCECAVSYRIVRR